MDYKLCNSHLISQNGKINRFICDDDLAVLRRMYKGIAKYDRIQVAWKQRHLISIGET